MTFDPEINALFRKALCHWELACLNAKSPQEFALLDATLSLMTKVVEDMRRETGQRTVRRTNGRHSVEVLDLLREETNHRETPREEQQ